VWVLEPALLEVRGVTADYGEAGGAGEIEACGADYCVDCGEGAAGGGAEAGRGEGFYFAPDYFAFGVAEGFEIPVSGRGAAASVNRYG